MGSVICAKSRGTWWACAPGDVRLPELSVECTFAFRAPPVLAQYAFDASTPRTLHRPYSYSPLPAELRLDPVGTTAVYFKHANSATVITRHVAGYEKLVVNMPQVDLSSYQVGAR